MSAPRIVLAEDDLAMREYLTDLLVRHGYEVTAVADGAGLLAAVRAAEAQPYDVLVSDVRLPGALSGTDVVHRLRLEGVDLHALLISAFGSPELRRRAGALGASYLDKPFSPNHLLALLERRILRR